MSLPPIRLFNAAERPDLHTAAAALSARSWPAFLDGNHATQSYWGGLFCPQLAPFQFFAVGADAQGKETLLAASNSIPFAWPGLDPAHLPDRGWDEVIETGTRAAHAGAPVNALSALAIMVEPDYRRSTLAEILIANMKDTARLHGLSALVAPIRPTRKRDYPLASFADYVAWTTEAGEPFDPWIRKHWRLGARTMKIAPRSMTVAAPVAQWETWTGLRFPRAGQYHVPGALAPVNFASAKQGVYLEPNLWMRHQL